MAKIEQSETQLTVTIGFPIFNGSIAVFDRSTGRATIRVTNLFFKSKPKDIALDEIASVELVRTRQAAFPRITLKSGQAIALPSAGNKDANQVIPAIRMFLGID